MGGVAIEHGRVAVVDLSGVVEDDDLGEGDDDSGREDPRFHSSQGHCVNVSNFVNI